MSARAILPGGVIAAMLTAAALLALLVALSIRGEGPFSIGLGDAGGTARLEGGGAATLGEPGGGPVETAPVVLSRRRRRCSAGCRHGAQRLPHHAAAQRRA